jgi:homoserine kinase
LTVSKLTSCTATAPSSTANLGPGYDVFGLGIDAFNDKVMITKKDKPSKPQITIKISGQNISNIPVKTEYNSAGVVLKRMAADFRIDNAIEVKIHKKIPAGFGVGSSAGSAVAATLAFDRLFNLKNSKEKLVEYAAEGETASAGIKHYDNVSGSLLGGFIIVRTNPKLEFIKIDPPKDLFLVIAVPLIEVPKRKTAVARSVLPKRVPLGSLVHNISNASTVVAGFILNDVCMIAKGINDVIIEPARKHLIPGYETVIENALQAGALAVTISGAGPTMISFLKTDENGKCVAEAMRAGFRRSKIKSKSFICRPSDGAKIIRVK